MTPLPQIAIELIGIDRIVGQKAMREGNFNRVWRVTCNDGAGFVVKRFRSRWGRENEVAAHRTLRSAGLAGPEPVRIGGTVMVWRDTFGDTPKRLDEPFVRQVGYYLRQVHRIPVRDPTVESAAIQDLRTLSRIVRRAVKRGYRSVSVGPVHGDLTPTNCLALPDGSFLYPIDWEEFGIGDPAADLMVALVEFGCAEPRRAADLTSWLVAGYRGRFEGGPGLDPMMASAARNALLESCFFVLRDWAVQDGDMDLAARYDRGREAAIAAISALPL